MIDGLRNKIDGLFMGAVFLVWPEAHRKDLLHGANVFMALGRERRGGFAQRGVERIGDFGSGQRLQEITAKHQRHQLRGGETEGGNIAKAFHQFPAGLAVMTVGDNREADRFQGLQIASDGARVFRIVFGDGFDESPQGQAGRTFEPPQ